MGKGARKGKCRLTSPPNRLEIPSRRQTQTPRVLLHAISDVVVSSKDEYRYVWMDGADGGEDERPLRVGFGAEGHVAHCKGAC